MDCMGLSRKATRSLSQRAIMLSKFCFLKETEVMRCRFSGWDLALMRRSYLLRFYPGNNKCQTPCRSQTLGSFKVWFSFFQKSGGTFFCIFGSKALPEFFDLMIISLLRMIKVVYTFDHSCDSDRCLRLYE